MLEEPLRALQLGNVPAVYKHLVQELSKHRGATALEVVFCTFPGCFLPSKNNLFFYFSSFPNETKYNRGVMWTAKVCL